MSVQNKRNFITKAKLCWNCLRYGHRVQTCRSSVCRLCNGKHHSLLHSDTNVDNSKVQGANVQDENKTTGGGANNFSFKGHRGNSSMDQGQDVEQVSEVFLTTAIVRVQDQMGNLHKCRALLDCGSQSSFMTKDFQDKLGLPTKRINISILGIGPDVTNITHSVNTRIYSTYSNYKIDSAFLIIDKISNKIPSANIDISTLEIPRGIFLADASFGESGKVDMLLGASIFWDILGTEKVSLGKGKPIIQGTKLGYVVAGSMGLGYQFQKEQCCNLVSNLSIQEQLERFWVLEEVGKERFLTKEEEECETLFATTSKRDDEGRFVVKLPFRTGGLELGDSFNLAMKRYTSMERKLEKNEEVRALYHEFMHEYIELGHMSKIDIIENTGFSTQGTGIYYLPHHSVLKNTSTTTKLRVVFDASAATTNGVSLNNNLIVGPKLQDDIFSILLRLRMHSVVITADVAKMYRQVLIADEDRDYQRILWRFAPDEPLGHYRLNTFTYGMASSGFLAVKCMQQLADFADTEVSEARRVILKDFYMDDLLSGAETIDEAIKLKGEVSQLLAAGGFILRKWSSNKQEVIANHEGGRNIEHYISCDNTESKTLGLRWNARSDTLHYNCPADYNKDLEQKVTKRHILSLTSKLFDPLGLISPLIIKFKLLLQILWKEKLGWDEEVPQEVTHLWFGLQSDFQKLDTIEIKRHAICKDHRDVQLHGFCDASQRAYGACIFVRSVDQEGNCNVVLLCSKSRVAPLKTISLPRLELCGALLLAKLTSSVLQSTELKPSEVRFWSDSSIVLCWLAGEPSNWTTFVANRTAEIQSLTQGQSWNHVSSEDNPADLLSRGVDCENLKINSLWWKGPNWLLKNKEHWPLAKRVNIEVIPEQRVVRKVFVTIYLTDILNRLSSFSRLHRAIAFCLRFVYNCTVSKELRKTGPLTVEELNMAWTTIIKLVQLVEFGSEVNLISNGKELEKSSKIISLNPFLDSKGLLRVGDRLVKANLDYEQKFPVILPSKHSLTKLIILHEHLKYLHAGPQALPIKKLYCMFSRKTYKCTTVNG